MKKYSTLFLKIAVFLIGLPVLAACFYILPKIIFEMFTMPAKGVFLLLGVFCNYVGISSILFHCLISGL